jgi:chromosome segregation ATPase
VSLSIAQSSAYTLVGVVAVVGTIAAAVLANRTRKQVSRVEMSQAANESAITGLDHLATQLQKRLLELEDELREAKIEAREARSEVRALRRENTDVKLRLDECKRNEQALTLRVEELERQ